MAASTCQGSPWQVRAAAMYKDRYGAGMPDTAAADGLAVGDSRA